MSVEQNKAVERRFAEEVLNQGRLEVFDELISADFHEVTEPSIDATELRRMVEAWVAGMPDLHATIERLVAEGDQVAVVMRVTGTHTATYIDLPPSGRKVEATLAYVDRLVDGKVVESWTETSAKGFYEQISGAPYKAPVAAG